ncbi:MAG: division/cell wall cluster transcriptional repressor MraZ [Planctomycetota bacterium]|jgi:division/cell wall cluster transcriptional repressor MraZ
MNAQSWLSGEHTAILDGEARILLPVGLRNLLNPMREEVTMMASLEPEGCVRIRRVEQWSAYVEELRAQASQSLRHRRVMMLVAATSAQVKIDKQGRLRIPDSMMAKAKIERPTDKSDKSEVVIVGHFDDLCLWASEQWSNFCESAMADFGTDLEWLHCGDASRVDHSVPEDPAA